MGWHEIQKMFCLFHRSVEHNSSQSKACLLLLLFQLCCCTVNKRDYESIHRSTPPWNARTDRRRPTTAPPANPSPLPLLLLPNSHAHPFSTHGVTVQQLDSPLITEYKGMSRAELQLREAALLAEKRSLDETREQVSDCVMEALQEVNDLHAKEATLLEQLHEIEVAKRAATYKLNSAVAGLTLNKTADGESTENLSVVKFLLKDDSSNKPYATQPLAQTQLEMRLTTVEDVQALTYRASIQKIYEMDNLGLGDHPVFLGESINTRIGNASTAELHERIISYLQITRSEGPTSTTTTDSLKAPQLPTSDDDEDDEEAELLAQLAAVRKRKRASFNK